MPKVTVIPPTINPLTHDSDEQFTSYEAQVDYYTKFIQSKPDWQFVKVYTDEGISATNRKI